MAVVDFRPSKGTLAWWVWVYLWGPVALLIGFGPLLLANFFQFATLVVYPFSKPLFRQWNRWISYAVWNVWWASNLRRFIGFRTEAIGDKIPPGETAIVVANHQSMTDTMVMLCFAEDHKLTNDIKFMAKNELRYVPVFGWAIVFADFVMLRRDWAKDEAKITATFARFQKTADPFWLLMFPEGTRLTAQKQQDSRDRAVSKGFEPMTQVLWPRPKGFTAALKGLRGKVDAIYSIAIDYPGRPPKLYQFIRGDVTRVAIHIKRHPIATLPQGDSELADWLVGEFRWMDQKLEAGVSQLTDPAQF